MRKVCFLAILVLVSVVVGILCPTAARAQGTNGSFLSPGKLASVHSEIDSLNPASCLNCHAPGSGPAPDRCMKCHASVKTQVTTRTGFHANRGTTCEKCHGEHRGTQNKLIPDLSKNPAGFDHKVDTGWALTGRHATTKCIGCHTELGSYTGLARECSSCHEDPHGKAADKRKLLGNCEKCHDSAKWGNALPLAATIFDHTNPVQTDYVLQGQHKEVDCEDCHVDAKFVPLEFSKCTSCHVNPHRADFKTRECTSCHPTASTWEVPGFDHELTKYKLQGQHRQVTCGECHKGDRTAPIAFNRCDTCHQDEHRGQFAPRTCDVCHTVQVARWVLRDYDHSKTKYPLVGKHQLPDTQCEQCHGDGTKAVYATLAFDDCDTCHEDSHHGRFEPAPCQKCHIAEGWKINAFDHDTTDFPQTGKHVGLDCNKCHRDFQWTGIPHDSCNDCHYTKNPHTDIADDKCDSCHVTEGFDTIRFDHKREAGFDLNPAHDELKCQACHSQVQKFVGLDPTCASCHQDDVPWGHYTGSCEGCHTAEHWFPAGLGANDHAITGFPLRGAHRLEPCESCHPVGEPRGTAEPECDSCHSRDDPHQNMLGTACQDCHTEMSWLRTTWRHSSTGWPLRGAHRLAACVDCHAGGYVNAPTECYRCHETEAREGCGANLRCVTAHASVDFNAGLCDECHVVYGWGVGADRFPH